MNHTREQEEAIKVITSPWAAGKCIVLKGAAGTGKTTTLKTIVAELGKRLGALMAPTGKAARRAGNVTGVESSTIHRFIYSRVEHAGKICWMPKDFSEGIKDQVFIVDEASMVTRCVWEDLRTAFLDRGATLLLVGDGFQLPPVESGEGNDGHGVDGAHAPRFSIFNTGFPADRVLELTEVHRQALESPVLACATALRSSRTKDEAQSVIQRFLTERKHALRDTAMADPDGHALIAHRNSTRLKMNRAVRHLRNQPLGVLSKGEPLLVRRNNYAAGVNNGDIVKFDCWTGRFKVDSWHFNLTQFGSVQVAMSHDSVFGYDGDPPRKVQRIVTESHLVEFISAQLGYVLTCHNSQGSEWPDVTVLLEPSMRMMPEMDQVRWMYTGVTRAKSQAFYAHHRED